MDRPDSVVFELRYRFIGMGVYVFSKAAEISIFFSPPKVSSMRLAMVDPGDIVRLFPYSEQVE